MNKIPCKDCIVYARCYTELYHSSNRFETIRTSLTPKCTLLYDYLTYKIKGVFINNIDQDKKQYLIPYSTPKIMMRMQEIEDYFNV